MFGNGKLFISHTHEDNALCEPLLAALDAWQADYWFDVAQLVPGELFPDRIERAIPACDIFLRVCTPAAQRSSWMAREAEMARELRARAPHQRLHINLVLAPNYQVTPEDQREVVIDGTRPTRAATLRALREALGIPSRERRVSRRAVVGLALTSAAALGATAFAGKLLLAPDTARVRYVPTIHQPTPAPQTGAARLRWTYRFAFEDGQQTTICEADGTVYCLDGDVDSAAVFALDASTGTQRWETTGVMGSYAAPTVAGDTVYLTTLGPSLVALATSDGSQRWSVPMVTADTPFAGPENASAITPAGSLVLLEIATSIFAADATTGALVWQQPRALDLRFETNYPAFAAPVVAKGVVYACLEDGSMQALDLATGAVRWSRRIARTRIAETPALVNGTLYAGAGDGSCYAVDTATGAVRWRTALTSAVLDLSDPNFLSFVTTTPIVADGTVYIGSGGYGAGEIETGFDNPATPIGDSFMALDARTGAIRWQVQPSRHVLAARSPFAPVGLHGMPVIVGETIYLTADFATPAGLYSEVLYALSSADGSPQWSYQVRGGGYFASSPVVANGRVYFAASTGTVYALAL